MRSAVSTKFIDAIVDQVLWSTENMGPGASTERILKHIQKEIEEVRADPFNREEWADLVILALDGLWRSIKYKPEAPRQASVAMQAVAAVLDKQHVNRGREWPDWAEVPEGEPIEHVKQDKQDKVAAANPVPAPDQDATNPDHYTRGDVECIDAIESATLGKTGIEAVCVANVIKYLWRYEAKGGIADVRKAQWYLDRLRSALEDGTAPF